MTRIRNASHQASAPEPPSSRSARCVNKTSQSFLRSRAPAAGLGDRRPAGSLGHHPAAFQRESSLPPAAMLPWPSATVRLRSNFFSFVFVNRLELLSRGTPSVRLRRPAPGTVRPYGHPSGFPCVRTGSTRERLRAGARLPIALVRCRHDHLNACLTHLTCTVSCTSTRVCRIRFLRLR